jgi:hypothetical protein
MKGAKMTATSGIENFTDLSTGRPVRLRGKDKHCDQPLELVSAVYFLATDYHELKCKCRVCGKVEIFLRNKSKNRRSENGKEKG